MLVYFIPEISKHTVTHNMGQLVLDSMEDFQKVNAVYGTYFSDNPPARSTIEVSGLPLGALVEIEAIARR